MSSTYKSFISFDNTAPKESGTKSRRNEMVHNEIDSLSLQGKIIFVGLNGIPGLWLLLIGGGCHIATGANVVGSGSRGTCQVGIGRSSYLSSDSGSHGGAVGSDQISLLLEGLWMEHQRGSWLLLLRLLLRMVSVLLVSTLVEMLLLSVLLQCRLETLLVVLLWILLLLL